MNKKYIDINCDLGEYEDLTGGARDAQIMPYISACSIACGGHAGNANTMRQSIISAKHHHVVIGAHPSYPDRQNFGRQSMHLPAQQLYTELTNQIKSLQSIAQKNHALLHHVKPHGALYNDAASDIEIARVIVSVMADLNSNLKLYGQAHSVLAQVAIDRGIPYVAEAFIDRRYRHQNRLVPREDSDALIESPDEQIKQAENLITRHGVFGQQGQWLAIESDSLCLHGDQANALEKARAIHDLLHRINVKMEPPQ